MARATTRTCAADADTTEADANAVPALAVFDLDACLWTQEMYQLNHLVDPSNPVLGQLGESGEGAVGARSGRAVIALHQGQGLTLVHFSAQP